MTPNRLAITREELEHLRALVQANLTTVDFMLNRLDDVDELERSVSLALDLEHKALRESRDGRPSDYLRTWARSRIGVFLLRMLPARFKSCFAAIFGEARN